MKKGFTLIELLGVVVIIALLMALVFPSIINQIRKASSTKDSITMDLLTNAADLYVDKYEDEFKKENGNSYCITLQELVDEGYIKSPITLDGTEEDVTSSKSLQVTYDDEFNYEIKDNEECLDNMQGDEGLYTDSSGANAPDLMGVLTPVVYDEETDNWEIADPKEKWYDYDTQQWANAVLLSPSGKDKDIGDDLTVPSTQDDVASSDVLAMFVWIPRYSYTIKKDYGVQLEGGSALSLTTPGAIDIKFQSVTDEKEAGSASYTGEKDKNSSWYTHPAFTFGNKELSGIWVGKFETSHTTLHSNTTDNSLNCTNEECENADGIRILPNVIILRYNNISNFFYVSRSMSREGNSFGIDKSKTDTHILKNSEWGAVAYLSQSIYGKYGNKDYTNANKEVYKNDSSKYYTGRSSGKPPESANSEEGACKYDAEGTERAEGTGLCGPGASTTGNIYGIYDMCGGTFTYVMGNFSEQLGVSGFNSMPDSKYYDKYSEGDTVDNCKDKGCTGHGLYETKGWYGDYNGFISSDVPWFGRGGNFTSENAYAGMFDHYTDTGKGNSMNSFRIAFVPIA